jgi:hypothetical protein
MLLSARQWNGPDLFQTVISPSRSNSSNKLRRSLTFDWKHSMVDYPRGFPAAGTGNVPV